MMSFMNKDNPLIKCACGCGRTLRKYDQHRRPRRFISGHNGRKYKDPKQAKKVWDRKNKKKRVTARQAKARKIKINFIWKAGGKCKVCGYAYNGTNAPAFDFHHRKPSKKLFAINLSTIVSHSQAAVRTEFRKCDLMCSNCHRLLHSKGY